MGNLFRRADEGATEIRNIEDPLSTGHRVIPSSPSVSENTSLNHRGHRNGETLSKFVDPEGRG